MHVSSDAVILHGLWIILRNRVMISRYFAVEGFVCLFCFLALWAPNTKCHLVPLYLKEGRHLFSWYLQNWEEKYLVLILGKHSLNTVILIQMPLVIFYLTHLTRFVQISPIITHDQVETYIFCYVPSEAVTQTWFELFVKWPQTIMAISFSG